MSKNVKVASNSLLDFSYKVCSTPSPKFEIEPSYIFWVNRPFSASVLTDIIKYWSLVNKGSPGQVLPSRHPGLKLCHYAKLLFRGSVIVPPK